MRKPETQIAQITEWRELYLIKTRNSSIRVIRVILFALLAIALLPSCGRPTGPPTPTVISPSSTVPPTDTPLPTLTPTTTPIPCDPVIAGFCIVGGMQIFRRPIDAATGNDVIDTSYLFGSTQYGNRQPHHGVEFPNAAGTPVLAVYAGTVYYAGDDSSHTFGPVNNFYGNLIVIQHTLPDGQTVYTLYAHLSKVDAVIGQAVNAGDKIGEVGQTGWAIGTHLHFEVRFSPINYDSSVNPELWLVPHEGKGTAVIRLAFEDGTRTWAPLDIKYYPDINGSPTQTWQPEIYPDELLTPFTWENFLVGELPAGHYRVQFLWRSAWVTREFDVEAGKVTRVEIRMK